jgi:hypothetical protein
MYKVRLFQYKSQFNNVFNINTKNQGSPIIFFCYTLWEKVFYLFHSPWTSDSLFRKEPMKAENMAVLVNFVKKFWMSLLAAALTKDSFWNTRSCNKTKMGNKLICVSAYHLTHFLSVNISFWVEETLRTLKFRGNNLPFGESSLLSWNMTF